jgi:hypothetical protein
VQLFDSVKMYVFAFCVYALVAAEKLYELINGPAARDLSAGRGGVLLIILTVCVAIYLIGLLRKTSNKLERAVIMFTELLCVLEVISLIQNMGVTWAEIPANSNVIAVVHSLATVLAGVRTFQVIRHHRSTQEA